MEQYYDTNIQYGESNQVEYMWSETTKEKIAQIFYQLVRTNDKRKENNIKEKFKECYLSGNNSDKKLLLKILLYTRDIKYGKGEYGLCIALLSVIRELDVKIFDMLIEEIVNYKLCGITKPIGSWKDMKELFQRRNNRVDK